MANNPCSYHHLYQCILEPLRVDMLLGISSYRPLTNTLTGEGKNLDALQTTSQNSQGQAWEIAALGMPLTVEGEQCLALSRPAVNVWWLSRCQQRPFQSTEHFQTHSVPSHWESGGSSHPPHSTAAKKNAPLCPRACSWECGTALFWPPAPSQIAHVTWDLSVVHQSLHT